MDESQTVAAASLREGLSAGLGDVPGLRVEQSVLEGPAGPTLLEAARRRVLGPGRLEGAAAGFGVGALHRACARSCRGGPRTVPSRSDGG
jgi:hypothetical protein